MRRPGYREAIEWIAYNDDCYWLDAEYGSLSVTAALVRDLYGVSDEEITADLRKAWHKAYPEEKRA